ncbi:MAG TPA: DMT family transporter [Burkholderiaceae bacterium]
MSKNPHRRAVFLLCFAATLWSIAGVLTRQLDHARGFEVTFWRSVFAGAFVALALIVQQRGMAVASVRAVGRWGVVSGFMWCAMFCCFMIALTLTTVANTLIVMSTSPLLTALLARLVLHHPIALRTWLAIAAAFAGIVWMFAGSMSQVDARQFTGMLIAMGVPVAASINVVALKKAGQGVDLIPAVLLGAVFSAVLMLPLMWPAQTSRHDLVILAILGVVQLGFPCMVMVAAARNLSAPEIGLLGLIEVLLGPIWAWLGAGEVPARATLVGGGIVLVALVLNEFAALREINPDDDMPPPVA